MLSSLSPRLRWTIAAVWALATFAAAVLGLALWRDAAEPAGPQAQLVGDADIRSEFTLTDHTGRTVTDADFAGDWQLVFFGFTHCPDICPTTLAYMASVLDLLGEQADRVAPLFITVDPARDTVPVMAEYVSAFHPQLIGLTGTEKQVVEAAENFRTWYDRVEDAAAPDGYLMAHQGYVYLMRPDGRFEAVFLESRQTPKALAEEILLRLDEEDQTG